MNAQWNQTELSFETERLAGVLTADDRFLAETVNVPRRFEVAP